MTREAEEDTLEIYPPSLSHDARQANPLSSQVKLDVAATTHVGKVRESNEDNYLVVRGGRSLEMLLSSVPDKMPQCVNETGYAMIVADGMGGAAAGEIASSTAMLTLVSLVLNTPDWILQTTEPMPEEIMARLEQRFVDVDAAVSERAKETPELTGMGTTLTVAWSIGYDLFIGHVGDSRAYLYRRGELRLLTRDQTLAQSLIDRGMLPTDQNFARRFRHILTQAIGTSGRSLQPEINRWRLEDGDRLLLCTDGLNEMVDDSTIASILGSHEASHDACEALLNLALNNGGVDNITVVLGRYQFPDQDSNS